MSRTNTVSLSATSASRMSKDLAFTHQPTYITLSRMLTRMSSSILLLPPPESPPSTTLTSYQSQILRELSSPLPYHRTKTLHNIEHARTLLLQLEHSAQSVKVQRVKRDVVRNLAEKRAVIKKIRMRVEEFSREAEGRGNEKWPKGPPGKDWGEGETVEQILSKPPLIANKRASNSGAGRVDENDGASIALEEEGYPHTGEEGIISQKEGREDLFGVRRRKGQPTSSPSTSIAQTSGFSSLPTTERTLLDSSRVHEDITTSLVSLAAQLKQSTRNFQASLESDKGLLDRALEGLDKNVMGMEAASKRMGVLRRMSEGQGWWGRIILYAWIVGLWVCAVGLVFIGPKFRF